MKFAQPLQRLHLRDRRRQRRLAMVNVTDRSDVHVRLCPFEFSFAMISPRFCFILIRSFKSTSAGAHERD
jgi:hypothetical protein